MKFSQRHIGISSSDEKYMLDFLGIDKIDTLISQTIPDDIRMNKALNLENEMSESQFLDHIYKQSEKNKHFKNYIGLGPLSGVYTAMNWTETQSLNWVLTLPCDVPFFPNDIFFKVEEKIKNINKNIKIISFSSNKKKHPIISAWNMCLKKELKFALENGVSKVDTFVSRFKNVYLNYNFDAKSLDPFFNINSENEIKKLENYKIN